MQRFLIIDRNFTNDPVLRPIDRISRVWTPFEIDPRPSRIFTIETVSIKTLGVAAFFFLIC